MRRSRAFCVLAVLAVTASGCVPAGPTWKDVIDQNRGAYERLMHRLDAIVATLPTAGSVRAAGCVPGATFDGIAYTTNEIRAGTTNTVEFVMERQVRDPGADADPERDFDLAVGPPRTRLPVVIDRYERPLDPAYAELEADDSFTREITTPLAARYVVISRALHYKRPRTHGRGLTSGEVRLESFLARVADEKVLCSFITAMTSDQQVAAMAESKLQAAADDDLAGNARGELATSMTRHTGHSFDLIGP